MELVVEYLREGVDIILSDTDAIWKRNPFPDLNKYAFQSSTTTFIRTYNGTIVGNDIVTIPPSDIIAVRSIIK